MLLSQDALHRVPIAFLSQTLKEGNTPMLSKNQVIDAICRLNPTAPIQWLARFELVALRRYYEHLLITLEPRGSRGWVRDGESSAVVTRIPAA